MYTKKIYFSGGDFHELQEVFRSLPGVQNTRTGYINAESDAGFHRVATGEERAYMGVEVTYNPKKMDLSKLMDVFFAVVNPYLPDGQGICRGEMYRAGVFYGDVEDEPQVELHLNFIASRGKPPAVSCIGITMNDPNSNPKLAQHCYALAERLKNFREVEPEHQDYLQRHPETETFIDFEKFRTYVKF